MGAKGSKVNPRKAFSKQLSHKHADDFLADLIQANELAGTFTDPQGYYLKFTVCAEDKILPGKLFPQINSICLLCSRLTDDGAIISQRELTVTQFYLILTRLRDNFCSKGKLHHLALVNPLELTSQSQVREEECIICMSEPTDTMLPCAHPYCQACIKKWSLMSKECPVCRGQFSEERDPWIFTSKPSFSEMASDIHEFAEKLPIQPLDSSNHQGSPEMAISFLLAFLSLSFFFFFLVYALLGLAAFFLSSDYEGNRSSKRRRKFPFVRSRG